MYVPASSSYLGQPGLKIYKKEWLASFILFNQAAAISIRFVLIKITKCFIVSNVCFL